MHNLHFSAILSRGLALDRSLAFLAFCAAHSTKSRAGHAPAGVKRMADGVYCDTRAVLVAFLRPIVQDAALFAEHGRRFTVRLQDVLLALKRRGRCEAGAEPSCAGHPLLPWQVVLPPRPTALYVHFTSSCGACFL